MRLPTRFAEVRLPLFRFSLSSPAPYPRSIHRISDQTLLDAFEFSQGHFQFKWLAHIPAGTPASLPLCSRQ